MKRARERGAGGGVEIQAAAAHSVLGWWLNLAGGTVRAKVLFLLACVLALDFADVGTVGAIAGQLEHALSLSNTQLGLLAAIPSICSALVTVPMGVLVDRTGRVRLLWVTMLVWSAAQAISGFSQSFTMLLLIRVGLGAATGAAIPAVTSLVGDLFPGGERGRVWGLILSGQLIGAAFGYLIAGEAATFGPSSWRYAFFVLAVPSVLGALAIHRFLREPARGGLSRLERGATKFVAADDAPRGRDAEEEDQFERTRAQEKVEEQRIAPDPALVLHSDPARLSLWEATRYVLRVRTNVVLIIASALGYFYFTAVTTFGLIYFEGRYHVGHGTATLLLVLIGFGGLIGVVAGGRLADRGVSRGSVNSRINVGAASFALAALMFLPGLLSATIAISVMFFFLAGIAFGARDPAIDAARLDIMHHRLWGRAEAVRTFLRRLMTATAPIVFGVVADALVPPGTHASANGANGFGANASAHGLQLAFLILLFTVALGGILTFIATRTYPRDIATALASEAATSSERGDRATSLSEAA